MVAARSNLGESLLTDNRVSFMSPIADAAPALELDNPQQIVALPLGQSRETRSLGGPTEVRESPAASHLFRQR